MRHSHMSTDIQFSLHQSRIFLLLRTSRTVTMSKKFKSQASSARAASTVFGGPSLGFGSQPSPFQTKASPLSYVTEVPDLSGISDPSIVVAFKNLTKKDSVTKGKALEDLQESASSNLETGTEATVLEAWVGVFCKT